MSMNYGPGAINRRDENIEPTLRRVASMARIGMADEVLEIIVKAKADYKTSEAILVLRDIERLVEIAKLRDTRNAP